MKSPLTVAITTMALLIAVCPSPASAGNEHSGGGVTIVCRNKSDDSIANAWLLDTYEWPKSYALKMPLVASTGNTETDAQLLEIEYQKILAQKILQLPYNVSLKRMLTHQMEFVKTRLLNALKKADTESADTYIYAPPDIGMSRPVRIPKGCKPEHVVFYTERDLDINPEIWNALSITDRVALITHESIYSLRRTLFNDKDSAASREHVASLVALASDSTDKYKAYDGFDTLNDYRRVISQRYCNGNAVRLSFKEAGKIKSISVRIRLYDTRQPGKAIKTEYVDVTAGQMREVALTVDWSKLEVTVLNGSNEYYSSYSDLLFEAVSTFTGEIETSGTIWGQKGQQVTLQSAWLFKGNPVQLPTRID